MQGTAPPSRSHRGFGAGAAYGITNCSSLVSRSPRRSAGPRHGWMVQLRPAAGPSCVRLLNAPRRVSPPCYDQQTVWSVARRVAHPVLLYLYYFAAASRQQQSWESSCSLEYCVEITADSCEFVIAASVFSERFFRFLLCVVGRSRPLPFRPFRPVAASALV